MNLEVGSWTAVKIGVGAYHVNIISLYLKSEQVNDSESIQIKQSFPEYMWLNQH